MSARLRDRRLVIATHNQGKLREIAALLVPFGVKALSAADLGLPEPEETEASFAGNALLKARAAASVSGEAALADDSGLCVEALGGAPGIHSARWAGEPRNFNRAMAKVERELAGNPDRRAHFICVLALAFPGGESHVFEGRVDGRLVFPPRGTQGFGYDPIFIAEGETLTYGEMDKDEKERTNHRARAFAKLIAAEFGD